AAARGFQVDDDRERLQLLDRHLLDHPVLLVLTADATRRQCQALLNMTIVPGLNAIINSAPHAPGTLLQC
ncbi:MAG: hypothetical protein ACRDOK_19485, partial [Streptosporangiaceae bacterium]